MLLCLPPFGRARECCQGIRPEDVHHITIASGVTPTYNSVPKGFTAGLKAQIHSLWYFLPPSTNLQTPGVQHFGVLGEVHLHAAILIDCHCNFLQRLVPAVRTEDLGHICCGSKTDSHIILTTKKKKPLQHIQPVRAYGLLETLGVRAVTLLNSPEAGMAAQNIVPGLSNQHPIHRQDM